MTDREKEDLVDVICFLVVILVFLVIHFAYFVGTNVINLISGKALESWSAVEDDFGGALTL